MFITAIMLHTCIPVLVTLIKFQGRTGASERCKLYISVNYYPVKFRRYIIVTCVDNISHKVPVMTLTCILREMVGAFWDSAKTFTVGFFSETEICHFLQNDNLRWSLHCYSSLGDLDQISRTENESYVFWTSSHPIEFKLCMIAA